MPYLGRKREGERAKGKLCQENEVTVCIIEKLIERKRVTGTVMTEHDFDCSLLDEWFNRGMQTSGHCHGKKGTCSGNRKLKGFLFHTDRRHVKAV